MYFNIAKIVVIVSWIIYAYIETKNKAIKWILQYVIFFLSSTIIFKTIFPEIKLFSATWQYMLFLFVVGIPFIYVFIKAGNEFDRQRKSGMQQEKISPRLFTLNKRSIIFIIISVALLICGRILDMQ